MEWDRNWKAILYGMWLQAQDQTYDHAEIEALVAKRYDRPALALIPRKPAPLARKAKQRRERRAPTVRDPGSFPRRSLPWD